MHTNEIKLEIFKLRLAWGFASAVFLLMLVGVLLLVVGFAGASFAQDSHTKTFSSPAEAANALFQAAKKQDEPALEAILGAGKEVTSSSDDVEDKLEREQFSTKYQEMHRLTREADGSTVLYIGAENWPLPVPLVSKNGTWYFDSETGTQEILFRRVGENEAVALEVCEEFAIANKEHEAMPASYDPITEFAQALRSTDHTNAGGNASAPFHGYYFRIVNKTFVPATSRAAAIGDQKPSLVLVAYPDEYRSSGVKTFIVARSGIVYEKDLGAKTTATASTLKSRTSDWRPAE